MATCYRHPDRQTGVACSRCDRPICPDCMTPTSVGMRCPECAGDTTEVRRPAAGGGLGSGVVRATYTLIGINAIIFVAQLGAGGAGGVLFADGALCANAVGGGGFCGITPSEGGEWWRILTSGFLHSTSLIFHILLNMFVLFILGRLIEPAIGSARMVAIYFVSLFGGALGAVLLADPAQYTVGASGAIYGLFAATLLIARDRGFDQVVYQLGFWLVLNLVLTFSIASVSVGGHLGGLAAGAVAALIVIGIERRGGRSAVSPVGELAVLAGLGLATFAGAILVANQVSAL